jgi:hypothetical protein
MKKVDLPFWPSKFSKLPNGHGLKFLCLSGHYHPLCNLTVSNGWEKDQFTPIYKFTYFEMFHGHVTSLNFFKTTIPNQMKQPASSTNTRSLSGFEVEDMIYPCLYGCADGARA